MDKPLINNDRNLSLNNCLLATLFFIFSTTALATNVASAPSPSDPPALKIACAVLAQTDWRSPDEFPWDFDSVATGHMSFDFYFSAEELQQLNNRQKPYILKKATLSPKDLCLISGNELHAKEALIKDAKLKDDQQEVRRLANLCPRSYNDIEPHIKQVVLETALDTTLGTPLFVISMRATDENDKLISSSSDKSENFADVPEISNTKRISHFGREFFADPDSKAKDFYLDMSYSCKLFMPVRDNPASGSDEHLAPNAHDKKDSRPKSKHYNPNKREWAA